MTLDPESDRRLRTLFAKAREHAAKAHRGRRVEIAVRVVIVDGRVSARESGVQPPMEFPLDEPKAVGAN